MDITQIVSLIIAVVGLLFTAIFMPYIKSRASKEQLELIYKAVKIAVYAAEQLYNTMEHADPSGEIRRKYAARAVSIAAARAGIALTDSDIDNIVQAAVQELNLVKHGGLLPKLEGVNESMDS